MTDKELVPTITEFLRSEAKTIWKSLPPDLKRVTTKQDVFKRLKLAWKDGDRVKREHRQQKTTESDGQEEQG